ncbi:two-component response regulator [Sporocytophaga myxococcoides]|uniref:Two-component response regulator n=1 Tax=Sporocytophaga myxococcoides TaxID=153721 RepID=A0A098L9E4_9BACT|nr:response regulator [Sporocytophaga myxococcoides]GAL82989.1 two-component response regulator [Sporocytophaga myxococcoides]
MEKFKSILLIEDDDICNFITTKFFSRYQISEQLHSVKDGEQALDFLRSQNDKPSFPQIILLDLFMPIMDGFEFLEEFNQIKGSLCQSPEIIVLTVTTRNKDLERAKNLGVKTILHKPFNHSYIVHLKTLIPKTNN